MQVKIDTRDKFQVFSLVENKLADNFAEELKEAIEPCLSKEVKNVILNLKSVKEIEPKSAMCLVELQQKFYNCNTSFVICELQKDVENVLDKLDLLEILNITPTESEAGDIINMDEIERELLNEDNSL